MYIAQKVAAEKAKHPERFCPEPRCLYKTGGYHCPRHQVRVTCNDCHKQWWENQCNDLQCPGCGGNVR